MISLAPSDYDAIRLSIQVAIAATILSLPLGFAVAYLINIVQFCSMIRRIARSVAPTGRG